MKAQKLIHATRGQERAAECVDEPSGHGKCMNSRQAMDTHGSGACTKLKHHQFVPNQYKSSGPWVKGKRGYSLAVGRRGEPILEFPLKLFWRKCPAGMTYYPKERKMNWNH